MSNVYREVAQTGYLRNILNSFVGALIGLLLFFGSFFVIWWNEGRTNMALVAAESIPATANTIDAANESKFVAITGDLVATEPIGDAPYFKPGAYLQLDRKVEMFAWDEESRSETRDQVGGGSETVTEYTYEKKWTSSPENSANFKQPDGHDNPPLTIEGATVQAPSATLGAFGLDLSQLTLPGGTAVVLSSQNVLTDAAKLDGSYLFIGQGTQSNPQIGDVRISYTALDSPAAVTVFGQQSGERLTPYLYEQSSTFFRALNGDRNAAIQALQTEHTVITWLLRGGGFLMIWIGLLLVVSPLGTVAGVLPILKQITGFISGIVTFLVALVIWGVVTLIAVVLHNIWLALAAALLVVALLFFFLRRRQNV
jgi:LPXTG-motif cell wall-anchored protein